MHNNFKPEGEWEKSGEGYYLWRGSITLFAYTAS